jgi:hypothetical protein
MAMDERIICCIYARLDASRAESHRKQKRKEEETQHFRTGAIVKYQKLRFDTNSTGNKRPSDDLED